MSDETSDHRATIRDTFEQFSFQTIEFRPRDKYVCVQILGLT